MDGTTTFQNAGLKLKKSKYEWFQNDIEICTFQIDQEGVHILESKTRAVSGWPHPQNMKDVCGCLSITGYYCKFIWYYTYIIQRLYFMCKIDNKVQMGGCSGEPQLKNISIVQLAWNGEAEEAFEILKDTISKASILVLPEEGGEYVLHSDASKFVVGSVLSQK